MWRPTIVYGPRIPGEIYATNLEGTRNVMQAALRAGVERIVHTSSVATIALRSGEIADESTPLPENEAIGAYKRSKIAAERLVDSMVAEQGLPAVIVNPSTPVGPRDARPTPTGRIIVEAAKGRIPAFVDTGLNLVMWTMWRAVILRQCAPERSGSATFSAVKTSCSRRC
jgi:dihydroflavonol-4-reductase